MTTHVTASSTKAPARVPAAIQADDPVPLNHTDLDVAAGGGGGAGINPSRNGLRLTERP